MGLAVAVGLGVGVGVAVGVGVSVAVGDTVGVADGVGEGVLVAVGVGDGVIVDVCVDVGVAVAVGVVVGIGVLVRVGISVAAAVGVAVGSGVGPMTQAPMTPTTSRSAGILSIVFGMNFTLCRSSVPRLSGSGHPAPRSRTRATALCRDFRGRSAAIRPNHRSGIPSITGQRPDSAPFQLYTTAVGMANGGGKDPAGPSWRCTLSATDW